MMMMKNFKLGELFTFGRYGALLESFVGRQDLVEKIKGCIIDSGGADPLDTKVCSFQMFFLFYETSEGCVLHDLSSAFVSCIGSGKAQYCCSCRFFAFWREKEIFFFELL